MDRYKHTLLVTHVAAQDHTQLLEEAQQLIAMEKTEQLSLLQIVPTIPAIYMQLPSLEAYESKLLARSLCDLERIGDSLNIPKAQRYVRTGAIRSEVKSLLHGLQVDHVLADRYCQSQLDNLEQLLNSNNDWLLPFCWSLLPFSNKNAAHRHKH